MRYDEQDRESSNVEDRRGQGGGFGFPGGGGGIQIPIGGGMSLTTLLIIGAVMFLLGINPLDILTGNLGGSKNFPDVPQMPRSERTQQPREIPGQPGGPGAPQAKDDTAVFLKRVLADTEDVWGRVFQSLGRKYENPRLVMFTNATQTACGRGMAQMGPFYCPIDQTIYVDLAFYDELNRRFKAPGDFAQAYVIAHEVGHHVQLLFGIAEQVQKMKAQMDESESNQIQVRMELQADCLAGVWANLTNQMKNRLQPGDIEEGLNAAEQIGDDMIQKRTQGRIVPDAFTHGTSEQRARWFKSGFESGQIQSCETFRNPI